MPDLEQAVALRRAFFDLGARADQLEQEVEPLSIGILLFDTAATPRHANGLARARDLP